MALRVAIVAVAWSACAAAAFAAPAARLHVLTSFFPVYCAAANVAQDLAVVENLLPPGATPHDFQFSRTDMQKIALADLLVVNGLGMDSWLEQALRQRGVEKPVARLADGLGSALIPIAAPSLGAGPDSPWEHTPSASTAYNPHIWLDPILLCHGASNVMAAFQKADPRNAARYATNTAQWVAQLHRLDRELRQSLVALTSTPFITYHDAFAYFARRYRLQVVGVLEPVAEIEPSPKYLAALGRRARESGVKAIFDQPGSRSALVRRLGRDWNVRVEVLDTLEFGPLRPDAYERAMRANARVLLDSLR